MNARIPVQLVTCTWWPWGMFSPSWSLVGYSISTLYRPAKHPANSNPNVFFRRFLGIQATPGDPQDCQSWQSEGIRLNSKYTLSSSQKTGRPESRVKQVQVTTGVGGVKVNIETIVRQRCNVILSYVTLPSREACARWNFCTWSTSNTPTVHNKT